MDKNLLLLFFLTIFSLGLYSQQITLQLTFNAVNNATYVNLDRVKVMNRSQGGVTNIYWPDTTLTLSIATGDTLLLIGYSRGYPVTLEEANARKEQFRLFQNQPNPFKDQTFISMYIPEKGMVNVLITDIQGRPVNNSSWQLDKGNHNFRIISGDGSLFLLTAYWNGESQCRKIVSTSSGKGKGCIMQYIGGGNSLSSLKSSGSENEATFMESGILDTPVTNENYTFQFATNIPCPGTPTVTYEGQVYNTIQIFSQCWLKENLNVGTMINGSQNQTNNNIKEKYCYNNNPDSCSKYGGLYQWKEMMQYSTQQGAQGICPPGWHLPTDEEWKVLEGAVDSQYGIGDPEWDLYLEWRGFDAGTNLKATSGWYGGNNGTDLFGFSGLPGGDRFVDGTFIGIGLRYPLYTSTKYDDYTAWYLGPSGDSPKVYRGIATEDFGDGVRCLKDN